MVAYVIRQKKNDLTSVMEVVEQKVNVQVQDGLAIAETSAGKLFAVPFETDQLSSTPPVYEQDTPFGLSAQTPQPLPVLNEDGYVADPSQDSTRPVDADGYVFDKDVARPTENDAVYSVYNGGYLTVGQVMGAMSSIAPSSSLHSSHESAQVRSGADGDDDADRKIPQASAVISDDGYEPAEQSDTLITNSSGASPKLPAVYSIPYEESVVGLVKPDPVVYSLASLTETPDGAQAGPPVYIMASPEHQLGDYMQIHAQHPYEHTEL